MPARPAASLTLPPSGLGPARSLALTRIVAGLVIATSADVHHAPAFADLDPTLVGLPAGLDFILGWLPSRGVAEALRWCVVLAALLGAIGAYARVSFGVVGMALCVLLALPQSAGSVVHCHHLLWMAALLAASPCADVWSADSYFEGRPLRPRAQYASALGVARSLVVAIYFFPGLHKLLALAAHGDPGGWLRSHLAWKWIQAGQAPAFAGMLKEPWLPVLAVGAVAFELSVPALVAWRRTRPLALASAVAFHVATAHLLFIRFESLSAALVSLVDVGPRSASPEGWRATWRGALPSTRWVGGVLVLGAFAAGIAGATQGYPFACYPTFADPAPATMPGARVQVRRGNEVCSLSRPGTNAEWAQAFRIAGAYGDSLTPARARAYVRHVLNSRSRECPVGTDSEIDLVLERLEWDFEAARPRAVVTQRAYTFSASVLGMAPAGTRASISPRR